jgi:hypothetical protein
VETYIVVGGPRQTIHRPRTDLTFLNIYTRTPQKTAA